MCDKEDEVRKFRNDSSICSKSKLGIDSPVV